ncbi:MAG: cyclic nucleotide-binding/CBS domain-containing protein [bacterium]
MVGIEIEEFDDEFQTMQELMQEKEISLNDESFNASLSALPLKKPIVVKSGTSIQECTQIMIKGGIGCLLIVDGDEIKGIFTERDVLMKIAGLKRDYKSMVVDDFMTPNPVTLKIDEPLIAALTLMDQGGYRHVCIVDDKNRPIAVVSIKDIVSYIVDFFPQDVLNLPPHPIRTGTKHREGG